MTGYVILRRRPTEGENELSVYVADTDSTATTYTDTDVTPGIQHVYRVKGHQRRWAERMVQLHQRDTTAVSDRSGQPRRSDAPSGADAAAGAP